MQRFLAEAPARRIRGIVVERAIEPLPFHLPICVSAAQHVHLSAGKHEEPRNPGVFKATWIISGRAIIAVGARRLPCGPGEVAICLPSTGHRFWTMDKDNEICWFAVDGPLAEEFALHLGIRGGVHTAGAAPIQQIYRLMEAMKDASPQGLRKSSIQTIQGMYALAESMQAPQIDQVVRRAQQIIQRGFSDPDLSAESIAEELSYHRGSLSRVFRKQTDMTVIEYITHIRLQRAKALLRHTEDKVAWIAEQCGFRDATYFCRWLRKHTGTTARHVRDATYVEVVKPSEENAMESSSSRRHYEDT